MTNSSECSRDSCVYRVYERSGKCSWHDLACRVFQEKIQGLSNVNRKIFRVKLAKIQKDLEGNLSLKVYIKGIRNVKNLERVCFLNMGSFKGPPMLLIFQKQLVSQKVILYI